MIVSSINHLYSYVRDTFQVRVYKTLQDTNTNKEVITCQVYNYSGVLEKSDYDGKGYQVDTKV